MWIISWTRCHEKCWLLGDKKCQEWGTRQEWGCIEFFHNSIQPRHFRKQKHDVDSHTVPYEVIWSPCMNFLSVIGFPSWNQKTEKNLKKHRICLVRLRLKRNFCHEIFNDNFYYFFLSSEIFVWQTWRRETHTRLTCRQWRWIFQHWHSEITLL